MRRFCFRLAALFGCTVAELERRMTIFELIEWMAYDQLEPFGDARLVMLGAMQIRQQMSRDAQIEIEDLIPYMRRSPIKELDEKQQEELEGRMKSFFRSKAGTKPNGG